jgi:hypothetical protein
MIYKFCKDENGYEKWLLENKTGYVFNHFGTAEMNKMHHSTCYHYICQNIKVQGQIMKKFVP